MTVRGTCPYISAVALTSSLSDEIGYLISNGGMTVGEYDSMVQLKRMLDSFVRVVSSVTSTK